MKVLDCTCNGKALHAWDGERCCVATKEQLKSLEQDELASLRAENERFRAALKKIADQDYRGNRPTSATIAYKALSDEGRGE